MADASHQLRTPLTALRLSLDNIADGVDDDFVKEDVEQATAEVVRMSRLVNGLLVLARAEAKVTAAEPLPLWDIVRERLAVWRPAADERGVTIALGGSADGRPLVLTSPGHLDQVLDNVLSNALEVSPDGGTITVRMEPRGDEVMLSVGRRGPRHVGRGEVPRLRPLLARPGPDREGRLRPRPRRRQATGDRRRRDGGPGGRSRGRAVRADQPSGIFEEWWLTMSHLPFGCFS